MRRSLALIAFLGLAACTNEIDQSTRPQNIIGSYQLLSYAGKTLPATIRADSVVVVVQSGTLVLGADRTWTESVDMTTSRRGTIINSGAVRGSGTWAQVREYAYLIFNDTVNGYQFSGLAAGGDIVLENVGGEQLIYRH